MGERFPEGERRSDERRCRRIAFKGGMIMSSIFICVLVICSAFALATGQGEALGAAVLGAGEAAITLGLALAGAYMLWCGLLKIMERSGVTERLARRMARPVSWLLGREGRDERVLKAVCVNFTANLMGMGNAATPAGLEAMRLMAEHAREGQPTDGMCMFLLINASSLQLIPTTVISLRAACGAADPSRIVLPALIGSAASTLCAVLLGKLCRKVWPA